MYYLNATEKVRNDCKYLKIRQLRHSFKTQGKEMQEIHFTNDFEFIVFVNLQTYI